MRTPASSNKQIPLWGIPCTTEEFVCWMHNVLMVMERHRIVLAGFRQDNKTQ